MAPPTKHVTPPTSAALVATNVVQKLRHHQEINGNKVDSCDFLYECDGGGEVM